MRSFLSTYSEILLLRGETFRFIKKSRAAVLFALLLFVVATLLGGCGVWLRLPGEMRRPLISEQIERTSNLVARFDRSVTPTIQESLLALSAENLSFAIGELLPPDERVTAEGLAEAANRAGTSAITLLNLVNQQVPVPRELVDRHAGQPVTAEMIDDILTTTGLTPVEMRELMLNAAVSGSLGYLQSQEAAGNLESTITNIQEAVVSLALTPERIREIIVPLGLSPETVERLSNQVDQGPNIIQDTLGTAQAAVERLEPPLGVRFSRFLNLLGTWLATPFTVAAMYLPLLFVVFLVARALGGRATIVEHLVLASLCAAPAFLFFFVYAGNLSSYIPITTAYTIQIAARITGLIGIAWAAVILIKTLAIAHDFSYARAIASVGLAYVAVYVILPLVALWALRFAFLG